MDIKGIIESEFGFKVKNIVALGQGLDSIAYLVNEEYIFKMSKHEEARLNLNPVLLISYIPFYNTFYLLIV